ncbi:uncharacterized protein I206_100351 [Kwoniella pini CBS 10737]|uniref:Uncharacterized protein n=1 Tax=Kwoniella pini CBS 10737 TaxID=1296096 RepID=A0A1B9IDA8_9TREE|nr:uncharacterized protein I206_00974 [Kwoniella pini CBS 10737]OCF53668.1 hypothetical protein I206_00974 [Kwoniella pini CBS 10737]
MAPLLLSHFKPRQRSILSTLFTATFLGAFIVVAFPCPVKSHGEAKLDSHHSFLNQNQNQIENQNQQKIKNSEVVILMNQRGKRRFLEER